MTLLPLVTPAGTTVLVVAPPTLQRQGLLTTLREARPDLPVTTTADAHALPDRLRRDRPTLLILDTAFPDGAASPLLDELRAACPGIRILLLGGKRLPFGVARFLVERGGGLLLSRRATPGELLAAVAQLIGEPPPEPPLVEGPPVPYATRPAVAPESGALPTALSARELEVLQLVAQDCSSQEIAARLFISIRTVEAHRRMLLEKVGTRSMIGLVLQAVRCGWVVVG